MAGIFILSRGGWSFQGHFVRSKEPLSSTLLFPSSWLVWAVNRLQDGPFLSECKLGSSCSRVRQSSQRALLDRIPRLFQVCSISLGWTQASDLSGFSCPFCLPCLHYELRDLITIKNKQEKTPCKCKALQKFNVLFIRSPGFPQPFIFPLCVTPSTTD